MIYFIFCLNKIFDKFILRAARARARALNSQTCIISDLCIYQKNNIMAYISV